MIDRLVPELTDTTNPPTRAAADSDQQMVPVLTYVITCTAVGFCQVVAGVPAPGSVALLVALYTVAAARRRRHTIIAAVIMALGVIVLSFTWPDGPNFSQLGNVIFLTALTVTAGVLGDNTGTRRIYFAALADRAARLERERDQQAVIAAAAERARIAREMHDVVAHNLAVMIALADGAEFALHRSPEQAGQAISAVSGTGREALSEMRRLLGVLREDSSADGVAPQPGIGDIDDLVAQVRRAGLPVTLRVDGVPAPLPPGVQLTVFRLVQEALTNTLKHGGPGSTATIGLSYSDEVVEVDVLDTGLGACAGPPKPGGQGLTGMRERIAVYGGTVTAGPVPDGWRVHATVGAQTYAAQEHGAP